MSYMTLSQQEKHLLFYSFHTFARIRQHYFSKYWGTDAWAVPHLKFLGGPSPQSLLGLRPFSDAGNKEVKPIRRSKRTKRNDNCRWDRRTLWRSTNRELQTVYSRADENKNKDPF